MATTNRRLTKDPVVLRILGLLQEQGKMDKDLAEYLFLPHGAISKWKYDGSHVYLKHIPEICQFLDTTPNYLFLGADDGQDERMTSAEKELLRRYRQLDYDRRRWLQEALKYLSGD